MAKNSTIITSGSDIADKVRSYVSEHFLVDFGDEVTDETDLFAAGVIDSFGFVELVVFLETQFAVKFEGEELAADGLNSISNIVESIGNKRNAG